MTITLNPYLSFRNSAREAMTHYQKVFGGDLNISTFGESDGGSDDPADADKVMHAQLTTEGGFTLMASDAPAQVPLTPGGTYSISLSGDDENTLRRYWDGLADGGNITMPLEKAPWGDSFGMLTDRFGVAWMVNIAAGT